MQFNPRITETLEEFGINDQDALTYLLSLHFDLNCSFIPPILISKINTTGIVKFEGGGQITWLFPLFVGNEFDDNWSWLAEWMNKFKLVNSDRRGTASTVLRFMKIYFSENPHIRKEEVIGATDLYLKNLSSPKFCKKSHKFIYEGAGKMRICLLEEWVEKYQQMFQTVESNNVKSLNNKMQ